MTISSPGNARRLLPAVDRLLADPAVAPLVSVYGHERVRVQVREEIERARKILAGDPPAEEVAALVDGLAGRVGRRLEERLGRRLTRVINATGIFVHTNLGRAPLPRQVAWELAPLLDGYCDLELDLETGKRGERNRRVGALLAAATGAEAGLVVNNNAAAVVLVLATLAAGREVVVSRGELVEIGGSFRIPDIMEAAGARLVEVGTTNRTHPRDYERAIGGDTALLLKVHPSNYRLTGFVTGVAGGELAELAHRHGLPVVVDEGSGLIAPSDAPQLADHPSLQELIAAGCDLVCGSGDKLFGGPQAGLLVGRKKLVERCRKHPLYRAFRPNRFTYAALEEMLRRHLAGREKPLDRLWSDPAQHRRRLERVAEQLSGRGIGQVEIVPANAYLGGGSAPEAPVPGEALALPGDDPLLARLRRGNPPVAGYLREGRLMLDLRTVDPEEDGELIAAVAAAVVGEPP